jgi:nitrous oxide reductase
MNMTEQSHAPDEKRRKFLKGSLAAATGVAAASTVAGSALAGVADTEAAVEVEKEEGYRLTKHIADYYKSAAV